MPIATAEPPTSVVSSAPAPVPSSSKEIFVSQIPAASAPAPAPKPGSAKSRLFDDLKKIPKPEPGTEDISTEKTLDKKTDIAEPKSKEEPTAVGDVDDKKVDNKSDKSKTNPWKLVDEYKSKLAKAEADHLELSKRAIDQSKWDEHQKKLESESKRNQELEEEIKYVNYSKSKDFQEKYQKPYDAAWKRAMSELGELTVDSGDGDKAIQPSDILELVNLTLPEARARAEELYGSFANDVMQHRKEIRNLFDQQTAALEEAKRGGAEREKTMREQSQKSYEAITSEIRETWTKSNEGAISDPKFGAYFKPQDGDEHGNQRLAKGFELADRAFAENPMAPGLTTEQRKAIIQRHAAVRNRAAAFGKLVHMNETSQARIAELEKELSQFKSSTPDSGGSKPASKTEERSGMGGLTDALRKIAK